MRYRNDIQLLRGLAVIFVVLFHLQVPGFQSGFLGVDIFFVISGYLMATMYKPEAKGRFFAKRAGRLLPAYFATILVTVLAAAIVTKPSDFHQVSRQAFFGALFTSNVAFWMENSYFDKASFKPLLHLWSLSVEIQFYALVPLVSVIARKYRAGFALLALLSAALCFLAVRLSPETAFFMLPLRLWEFLIGFGVASYAKEQCQMDGGSTLARAGALVALVVVPLLPLDGTAPGFVAGHPGLSALVVTLATGALLALGLPASWQRPIGARGLIRLGEYSYALYLAHFPVIVLFLYQPFGGTLLKAPNASAALMLLLLIAVSSAALFKFVEQPLRHHQRALRFSATAAVAVFAAIPLALKAQSAFFPANQLRIYEALSDRDTFRCGQFYAWLHRGAISCNLTPEFPPSARRVLLVGNSHADAIKGEFLSVARARRFAVSFIVQNTPLMAGGRVGVDDLVREAIDKRVEAVVLHYSPGAVDGDTVRQLVEALGRHAIRVSLLLPIPVWQRSVPRMLIDHASAGLPLPAHPSTAHAHWNAAFQRAVSHIPDPRFRLYRADQIFCTPDCRMVGDDGRPYYFDDAHLTMTGSAQLRPVIEQVFDDLPH